MDRLIAECYPAGTSCREDRRMNRSRREFLHLSMGAAVLPLTMRPAHGDAFPSRPVTIVVPFPPGGPADTIARVLAERMRITLGRPVVVENIAGAGGSL